MEWSGCPLGGVGFGRKVGNIFILPFRQGLQMRVYFEKILLHIPIYGIKS